MKITFIRHSKVLFSWDKFYDAHSFDLACRAYDLSPIQAGQKMTTEGQVVYISNLMRTGATAKHLFQADIEVIETDLLNEIPVKAFINTKLPLPTLVWMVLGRLQWYFNGSRQPETRRESKQRINKFLDQILDKGQDCIIVGHGFYFVQMIGEMKRRAVTGDTSKRLKNEERREFFVGVADPIR